MTFDPLPPPGRAEKPLSLVAPLFGSNQCIIPGSFIFPPASCCPPRKVINSINSSLFGKCQPSGQAVNAAYQLYNTPYVLKLSVALAASISVPL